MIQFHWVLPWSHYKKVLFDFYFRSRYDLVLFASGIRFFLQ